MATKTFNIEGMTCASCVQTVEKATNKLPGVQESNVNLATEKLNISFDENAVSAQDIQNAVNKAGYKALTDVEQKSFAITCMTCASCVQTVEKATRKMDRVIECNVNITCGTLPIQYGPTVVSVSDNPQAVSSVVYEEHEDLETQDSVNEEKDKKQQKIQSIWTRFLGSAVFTIPLFSIAMGHMVD